MLALILVGCASALLYPLPLSMIHRAAESVLPEFGLRSHLRSHALMPHVHISNASSSTNTNTRTNYNTQLHNIGDRFTSVHQLAVHIPSSRLQITLYIGYSLRIDNGLQTKKTKSELSF